MPKKQRMNKPPIPGALAMTVEQFCKSVPISRATYEKLKREGKGPKIVRLGPTIVRISVESARAWLREREGGA